jgi:hypothetical protein
LVKEEGELVDGYGSVLGGTRKTPLMLAVSFKGIDIEVVKALLENGANVNLKNLFYDSEMANKFTDDRPTLLIYAADNLAYMGQEIARGGVLFNNGVNIKCDYYNKSILAYIISNYEKYVESVKEFVYKVIKEDEVNVGKYYDDAINKIGEVTLDGVEKCLMKTTNEGTPLCKYTQFLDNHIEKIRKYETRYLDRKNETDEQILAEYNKKQDEEKKIDLFVTAEAKKLIYDFIDKFLDHKDIVYLINREWKDDNTIVSCLGLLLNFYKKDESEITLKLIEKCVKKGADVNRVLYKIFNFEDPSKILKILDTNVDVTVSLIVSRDDKMCGEKGGLCFPYDNFLTYTIIKQNIPVLEFILGKLDELDRDKVVNCILSPNSYNTTSITAAMDIIKNNKKVELENFLEKYMEYDDRILIHGLKYAVKSGNKEGFMIANRIISTEGIEGLLKDMEIPENIKEVIDAAPGGIGAVAAKNNFENTKKKQKTGFGAEKRRSNRRKVHLAPTRKRVVKRRSLKKK